MRVNPFNFILRFAALIVAVLPYQVYSQSVVNGIVTDKISQQKIAGAEISASRGGSDIGSSNSSFDGGYSISFPVAEADRNSPISLKVTHPKYLPITHPVQLSNGQPVNTTYPISLVPADIVDCSNQIGHTIVIGRFRSPLGQQIEDLPERIRDALHFNLNHRLQTIEHLRVKPNFEYCSAAEDKWSDFGKQLAQFLKAHAYVYGEVTKSSDPNFKVRAFVSDAYDLFSQPYLIENDDVNLAEAASAIMNTETYAALLGSLAAGLAVNDDCESAITVVNVAENELGETSEFEFLSDIKSRCIPELPHNELLSGGS